MTLAPVGVLRKRQSSLVREEFNGAALRREWAVTDPEGHFALGGGGLAFTPYSVPATWDQVMLAWSVRLAPLAGLAVEWAITFSNFGATAQDAASWGMDESLPALAYVRPGFTVLNTGGLQVRPHSSTPSGLATPVTLATGVEYRFRIQFLPVGSAYLISQDRGASWQVLWVDTLAQNPTKLFSPAFDNRSATGTLWSVRWWRGQALAPALSDTFAARTAPGRADTGQPWLVPPGRVPPLIAGDLRIPVGQIEAYLAAWDGIADGVWECDINFGSAPSTQKAVYLLFRFRDAANFMRITLQRVSQQIAVVRNVLNVPATLANTTAAGFLDNTTYHFTVVAVGPVIVVYQDGVEKLRFSEPFGQYLALSGWYLNDNLATPDIRMDNVRAWGFPARPLLMDSFDRPDSAVDIGRADSGQAYVAVANVAGAVTWGIDAGRSALVSVPPAGDYLAATPLARLGFLASALVRSLPGNQGVAGPVFRFLDGQNYVYVRLLFTTNQLGMMRNLAGVRTSVTSAAVPALNANQDYRVDVQLTGNTIEVYLDGTRYISVSVAENATAPGGGVYAISNQSRQDDLRVLPLGTALAHDTFTRADSAVSLGSTENPGTAWGNIAGGTWGISANQAYNVDTSGARGILVPVLALDVDMSCDLVRQSGLVGLWARMSFDAANYLVVRFDGTNCFVSEQVAAGGLVTLASPAYAWPVSATARNVRLRLFRGVLAVYVNELLVVAQAFTGHNTAADMYYGLYCNQAGATNNRFDNFLVREVTAAPPAPLVSDTFTRADSAVSLGTAEFPPAAYTLPFTGTWGISAGKAYCLDTTTATRGAILPYGAAPDVAVQADLTRGGTNCFVGLLMRCAPGGGDYLYLRGGLATFSIFDRVAGGSTNTLVAIPLAWPVGATKTLRGELRGNVLTAYADGVLLCSAVVAGHPVATEGYAGFQHSAPDTTNRFDNLLVTQLPPATVPTLVLDTFARADSTITLGNAETGQAWGTLAQAAGTSTWGITSGKAYQVAVSGGPAFGMATVPTGLADVDVSAKIATGPGGGFVMGLVLRAVDQNNFLSFRLDETADQVLVRKSVGGTATTIASSGNVIAPSTTYALRVVATGTTFRVYLAGLLVLTLVEPDLASATRHGLFAAGGTVGTTFTWDDFVVMGAA